ncbi:MAG: hypothetical protein IPJ88_01680 [Myxococcales bacterium]|nr:MAG: hypothetical protein IPJ88_01680 [Myxococcales bacterium]
MRSWFLLIRILIALALLPLCALSACTQSQDSEWSISAEAQTVHPEQDTWIVFDLYQNLLWRFIDGMDEQQRLSFAADQAIVPDDVRLMDNLGEFLVWLKEMPNVHIVFWTDDSVQYNETLLKAIRLPDGSTAWDAADRVLGKEQMVPLTNSETGILAKDFSAIPGIDIARTIGIAGSTFYQNPDQAKQWIVLNNRFGGPMLQDLLEDSPTWSGAYYLAWLKRTNSVEAGLTFHRALRDRALLLTGFLNRLFSSERNVETPFLDQAQDLAGQIGTHYEHAEEFISYGYSILRQRFGEVRRAQLDWIDSYTVQNSPSGERFINLGGIYLIWSDSEGWLVETSLSKLPADVVPMIQDANLYERAQDEWFAPTQVARSWGFGKLGDTWSFRYQQSIGAQEFARSPCPLGNQARAGHEESECFDLSTVQGKVNRVEIFYLGARLVEIYNFRWQEAGKDNSNTLMSCNYMYSRYNGEHGGHFYPAHPFGSGYSEGNLCEPASVAFVKEALIYPAIVGAVVYLAARYLLGKIVGRNTVGIVEETIEKAAVGIKPLSVGVLVP